MMLYEIINDSRFKIEDFISRLKDSEEALNHVFSVPLQTLKQRLWDNSNRIQRMVQKAEEMGSFPSMERSYSKAMVSWNSSNLKIDFEVKRGVVCARISGPLVLNLYFKVMGMSTYREHSEFVDFSVMVFSKDFHGVVHDLEDVYLDLYTM